MGGGGKGILQGVKPSRLEENGTSQGVKLKGHREWRQWKNTGRKDEMLGVRVNGIS